MIHFLKKLQQRWLHFLHNEDLKQKVYTIVFESDTRKGRLFDLALMGCILLSVTLVMLESMHLLPPEADTALRVTEYVLTLFFTLEYLARIYCLKQPKSYVFSFFWHCRPAGHTARLSGLYFSGSTLSAGYPCLQTDSRVPHI